MRNRYPEHPVKTKKRSKPQCIIMWMAQTCDSIFPLCTLVEPRSEVLARAGSDACIRISVLWFNISLTSYRLSRLGQVTHARFGDTIVPHNFWNWRSTGDIMGI
jgi:hypothetical protein